MYIIKLYAHMIAPVEGAIEQRHFDAITTVEKTAKELAEKYNGRLDGNAWTDTVYVDNLSDKDKEEITVKYPFASIRKRY